MNYNKEVQRILREKYRISWKRAMGVVGYDFLQRFMEAGNMTERTAEAVAYCVKEASKLELEE